MALKNFRQIDPAIRVVKRFTRSFNFFLCPSHYKKTCFSPAADFQNFQINLYQSLRQCKKIIKQKNRYRKIRLLPEKPRPVSGHLAQGNRM
jgi:hypothetical protein